ncbi:hypothetical protein [Sphingobium ummariense]|uniref:hypothetical protein n=1 Tax=Sphingobium ummariense TaxID=420994 RepID=UPI0012694170|nr:hypothetical protein [Sphingobium ummariense]
MYTRHGTQSDRVYVAAGSPRILRPAGSPDPACSAPGALAASNKTIVGWFNQNNLRIVDLGENGAIIDFIQPGVSQARPRCQQRLRHQPDQPSRSERQAGRDGESDVRGDASCAKSWLNPNGKGRFHDQVRRQLY